MRCYFYLFFSFQMVHKRHKSAHQTGRLVVHVRLLGSQIRNRWHLLGINDCFRFIFAFFKNLLLKIAKQLRFWTWSIRARALTVVYERNAFKYSTFWTYNTTNTHSYVFTENNNCNKTKKKNNIHTFVFQNLNDDTFL